MRRRLLLSMAILSTMALVLWAGAAATTWWNLFAGHGLTIQATAACACTVLAGLAGGTVACVDCLKEEAQDKVSLHLADALVSTRRAARTGPHRAFRVQAVRARR